ncbi:MAG: hypothetical protein MJZ20_04525 [Bacteroidaceae bacterium]|nr:hypothetical protein [Bacteroidaceae bacterium]
MKKCVTFIVCTLLVCVNTMAQVKDIDGAMVLLKDVVQKFNDNQGLVMDLEMKAAVGGTSKFTLMKNSDRSKMVNKKEVTYFYSQMMWVCDLDGHNVIISNKYRDEEKMMASMATIPGSFKGDMAKIDDKSFNIGKNVFAAKWSKKEVEYNLQQGKSIITMIVDQSSKNVNQLKVKQGMMSVVMNYKSFSTGCSYDDVSFSTENYKDFRIIDER